MITDTIRMQFEAALHDANTRAALYALAQSLKSSGIGQVELYHLYSAYLHKTAGTHTRYDAIADTMDLIWGGPGAKGRALFENELTDADVQEPPP